MSNIPLLCNESYKRKVMSLARAKTTLARLKSLLSFRPRDLKPINGVVLGLTDPTCGLNMGQTAEILAQDFAISREEQDTFALRSHERALAASERCFMSGEIVPLQFPGEQLKRDLGPRKGQTIEKLAKLKPIFQQDGTVTPGNSCPLTDGAAAVLLAPEGASQVAEPLGYVSAYSIRGCDPRRMGLGPVFATSHLLRETGLSVPEIDLWEINEAFAAQVLACLCAFDSDAFARKHLGRNKALGAIDPDRLNIHGGAIALGHPVGTSGARIVLTLLRSLRERGYRRGIASLCVGGGQGVAMLVETV